MKDISIIIPSINFGNLQDCITSIIKHTDLTNVEVVVSLNGCEIEAIDYIKSLGSNFRFIYIDKRVGVSFATNLGVKISEGTYILKMDDDNVILDFTALPDSPDNWLNRLITPLRDKTVGQVGVVMQKQYGFDVTVGFLTATTREVWDKVGGLDTSFYPAGGEDVDYSIKVNKLGYKVVQAFSTPVVAADGYKGIGSNEYPLWHKSQCSWNSYETYKRNEKLLNDRYGETIIKSGEVMTELEMYQHDDFIFFSKLKEWGIIPQDKKLIILNCGLGDHLAFKSVLPEIRKKYPKLQLAVCYPEVFLEDKDIEIMSIEEGNKLDPTHDDHNIYKWCILNNWNGSNGNLAEAFKKRWL